MILRLFRILIIGCILPLSIVPSLAARILPTPRDFQATVAEATRILDTGRDFNRAASLLSNKLGPK